MQPWLAKEWTVGDNGRALRLKLRPGVMFHDGTPVDAAAVTNLLPALFRNFLGPLFADFEQVKTIDNQTVEIRFRRPTPFLVESLETPFQRSASVATGPYVIDESSSANLRANPNYYLGRPVIDRVQLESFPSVRAAWAELLRNHLDMLYEVGIDALPSMENATNVSVFTVTRRYQYAIALNSDSPTLRSPVIRRALNAAIDRDTVIKRALNGQGVPSIGPIWPRHWAFRSDLPAFQFEPERAAATIASARREAFQKSGGLRIVCLVPNDAVNERIALEAKRQLESVGVELAVQAATQDQIAQRVANRDYEAVLLEAISGPTLFRLYYVWHSNTEFNSGGLGNRTVDGALDRVRQASSDDEYRLAVAGLQQAFVDDPPAIFLAWSVRARAVSKRFVVPNPESGRDILGNLRLWTPRNDERFANRN